VVRGGVVECGAGGAGWSARCIFGDAEIAARSGVYQIPREPRRPLTGNGPRGPSERVF
jgi:hypothetical protein